MSDQFGIEVATLEKSHNSEDVESILQVVPLGESTQPTEDESEWNNDYCFRPPENLEALAALSKSSWIRSSAIEAVARNTVGLGFTIEPDPTAGEEVDEKTQIDVAHSLDALAMQDVRLDHPTFTELLFAVKTDEEEVGQGYIEVSRDKRTGRIDGLFHCPGKRVRRLKDRSGYLVLRKDEAYSEGTRYINYGEKVVYDDDGEPTNKLAEGASRWAVNELLRFRLYTSESQDYGLPRDHELALEYLAFKLAQDLAVGFFASGGTAPTILFVQGQESRTGQRITFKVPQATMQRIDQALSADARKGAKVAIIPVPPGTQSQMHQLGKLSDRDVTFDEFKKLHYRDVVGAFRLSPIFVGIVDDSGRYTAEVQRALSLEQVFDPEQRRYEERLQRTLLHEIGYPNLQVKFKRLAVEGDAVKRESASALAEAGAITMGELRAAHGWPPLREEIEDAAADPNAERVNLGKPRGAEDRTTDAEDQRGLRPGIGGRVEKAEHNGHGVGYVEEDVEKLAASLAGK